MFAVLSLLDVLRFRLFAFHVDTLKIRQTNYKCAMKLNVVCDRTEPHIAVTLCEYRRRSIHCVYDPELPHFPTPTLLASHDWMNWTTEAKLTHQSPQST